MLISLLLSACTTADSSWSADDLFGPAGSSGGTVPVAAPVNDPRFPTADELAALEDPWQLEGPASPDPVEAIVEEVVEAAPQPEVQEVVEEVAQVVSAPPAMGLATQPSWGVRLLNTLPQAVPPRAALGLPSGEEIVVAPGSMLPEVGVVVIAVGPDTAQLAKVTANGDHAVVEMATLAAQYPQASAAN